MSMLHIVNKSPFERHSLDTCLRLSKANSSILLIEDGVYAAMARSAIADKIQQALGNHRIYALEPDLDARGIAPDNRLHGVEMVDYDGFVALTTEHDQVQSWL